MLRLRKWTSPNCFAIILEEGVTVWSDPKDNTGNKNDSDEVTVFR